MFTGERTVTSFSRDELTASVDDPIKNSIVNRNRARDIESGKRLNVDNEFCSFLP